MLNENKPEKNFVKMICVWTCDDRHNILCKNYARIYDLVEGIISLKATIIQCQFYEGIKTFS